MISHVEQKNKVEGKDTFGRNDEWNDGQVPRNRTQMNTPYIRTKPSPLRTSTRPSQQNHYDHTNLPPSDLRMNQDTSKVNARHDESKTQTRTIRLPEADTTHKLLRPAPDRCDLNILEHPTSCYAYFLVERICNLFIVYGFLVVSVWEREGK